MAFIAASAAPLRTPLAQTKSCALFGAPVAKRAVVVPQRRAAVVRMSVTKYPNSSVLGLGADVPSSVYLILSAIALPLGCYSVFQSNIGTALTAESVNPQFIVGSLLVPISWGLHVAGFIQMKNGK